MVRNRAAGPSHEDGIILTGTFTPAPRARELTRAAHMQGDPVRVTVRFSNGLPDPHLPDAAEYNPRGMAVMFSLPDATTTNLVCHDRPVVPAGTPEGSSGLIARSGEGPRHGIAAQRRRRASGRPVLGPGINPRATEIN